MRKTENVAHLIQIFQLNYILESIMFFILNFNYYLPTTTYYTFLYL